MRALWHEWRDPRAAYMAEVSFAEDIADFLTGLLLTAGAIALAIGILSLIGGSHG